MWGSACPATCTNPEAHHNCTKLCVESCQCTRGHLLSGGKCGPPGKCSFLHYDSYYLPKENFWKDNECQEKCICQPNSRKVVCAHSPCQHGEVCRFLNGVQGCHRDSPIMCRIKGVARYTTFDDRTYDVTGNCTYLLACYCTSWWSLKDCESPKGGWKCWLSMCWNGDLLFFHHPVSWLDWQLW